MSPPNAKNDWEEECDEKGLFFDTGEDDLAITDGGQENYLFAVTVDCQRDGLADWSGADHANEVIVVPDQLRVILENQIVSAEAGLLCWRFGTHKRDYDAPAV